MLLDDVDASWTVDVLVQQTGAAQCCFSILRCLPYRDENECALCLPPGVVVGSKAAIAFVTVSFSPSELVSASNTTLTSLSSSERQATMSYSKPSPSMSHIHLPPIASPPPPPSTRQIHLLSQIDLRNGEITPQDLTSTSCATTGASAGENFYHYHSCSRSHFRGYHGTGVSKHTSSTILPIFPQ